MTLLLESAAVGHSRTTYRMHTKQPWLSLTIGSVAAVAAATASAAGLGAGGSSAVLGQPLDFPVQVRLESGEVLAPECVSAEVRTGDRRLPPGSVRTQVQTTGPDTARIRVLTAFGIDEPVVEILLAVGCTTRISRQYVVLADPPNTTAPSVPPSFAANPAPVQDAAVGAPAGGLSLAGLSSGTSTASGTEAQSEASSPKPTASEARVVARPAPPDPEAARRRAERRAERQAALAARQAQKVAQEPVGKTAPAQPRSARLQLDFIEPPSQTASTVEAAMQAVAQAASAAKVAASAASASAERIGALERTVEQLRTEAKTNRDLAAQFKQRLVETEGSSNWAMPLAAIAALLAGLAAWLAWRLGKVQNQVQSGWREAAAPPPSPITEVIPSRQSPATVPFITSDTTVAALPVTAPAAVRGARMSPAWPPPAPLVAWPPPDSTVSPETRALDNEPEPAMQKTEPMPPLAQALEDAPRDVSIEELIDLEQQAEFFVVLGQDEAAIDLLVEHLRSTGGGSPLPYLKLLEIHHRLDQREAYERTRDRFNHRFNAYAPDWGVDLGHGRSLDDYPGVIPRLQQVWSRPLDAMAELEALLFRKSRGELFDLPAYREVLFLYSLARDLLDRASAGAPNVDLLIPMADGGDFSSTAPSPYLGLERDAFRDTQIPEDRPTVPVDFDVSSMARPTSIFDLLDDKPHVPGTPDPGRGPRQI